MSKCNPHNQRIYNLIIKTDDIVIVSFSWKYISSVIA